MASKQTIVSNLAPLTAKIANAIKDAASVRGIDFTIVCEPSVVEFGTDVIRLRNDKVCLTVVVYRRQKTVNIYGCMYFIPGKPIIQPMRFEGEIVLDFSKPEMKADGNMFVDVFARMMKQYNAIASLMEEKIVY